MKKTRILLFTLLTLALSCICVNADTITEKQTEKAINLVKNDDRYITDSDAGRFETARLIVKGDYDFESLDGLCKSVKIGDYYLLQFSTSNEARLANKELNNAKSIEYSEPDILYKTQDITTKSWVTKAIKCPRVINYANTHCSASVKVAVIDSGVDVDHPYLKDHMLEGYDFINNDTTVEDNDGHGTHCSGIIVDCTQSSNVKILPLKAMDVKINPVTQKKETVGSVSIIALAIEKAITEKADIINLSLGGDCSTFIEDAVKDADDAGILVVAAAGNTASSTDNVCPAHISSVITVGSVDCDNAISYFSNYGNAIDVVVSGENIYSCFPFNDDGETSHTWKTLTGTSMAAPHVVGALALLKETHSTYTKAQIENLLYSCCDDLGTKGKDIYYGNGVINLDKLECSHIWDENYTIDKEATCTVDGSKSIHCKYCSSTKDSTVIPASHKWDSTYTVDKAATCEESGIKSIHCKNCSATKDVTVIPALEHNFEQLSIIRNATCESKGLKKVKCSKCNKIKYEDIPALEHNFKTYKRSAGYLRNGYSYKKCVNCGEIKDKKALEGYTTPTAQNVVVSSSGTSITIKWDMFSRATRSSLDGYQIRYSRKASMIPCRYGYATINSSTKTISKLERSKKYYVQVRTFKDTKDGRFYSAWTFPETAITG